MSTDRIEKKIVLHATPSRVWRALSDATEFGEWFGVRFDGPFRPGKVVTGKITPTTVDARVAASQKPYEGMPFEITVEQMEPEKTFSFRWHPFAIDPEVDYSAEPTTMVVFTIVPVAEGVELTVSESGFDRIPLERRAKAFTANEGGWSEVIHLIEKYVAKAA
jgi:uncharacterized protein YndB with AHSA1/START domain